LPLPPVHEHLEEYVRYLDLSNHQVFLRMERRVSKKTWHLWADGIKDNLERDGFRTAWTYVRQHRTRSYNELKSFYEHWEQDPGWWSAPWWAVPIKRLRRYSDRPEARKPES
jgi:hypothetical protein